MRTIDVIILKGGRTAKEINPLGDKPQREIRMRYMTKDLKESFKRATDEWQEAENKRRTFEIDFSDLIPLFRAFENKLVGKIHHVHIGFDEGTYHKAQIIHTAKIKIMSKTTEVVIQLDGKSAKEVNPIKMPDAFFEGRKKEWNEAEKKLRTFKIESAKMDDGSFTPIEHLDFIAFAGKKRMAEILPNRKIKLL